VTGADGELPCGNAPRLSHPCMQARLTPALDLGPRAVGAWREIAVRALEPNPYNEPKYLLPLARCARAHGSEMMLLTVESESAMVGCLSLYGHDSPGRSRTLRSWTVPNGLRPLIDREHAESALERSIGFLSQRPGLRRFLRLERIATDGPIASALHAALQHRHAIWQRADPPT
jgi:hypothetical protein